MANYSTLKAAVADVVKTNGTQAITGANLQSVLLSIINSIGGGGYIFKGVATPSTNAGTPDQNVFYIGGAGTYANFGTSMVVPPTNIAVFKYNGTWTCEQVTVENGGVFDISAFHAVGGTLATYADLAAALGTGGANVPDGVRKGGMSIKFVQSSDNNYVQYRLMSDSFNTTVTNWQGLDERPSVGSKNLVTSGSVVSTIEGLTNTKFTRNNGYFVAASGSISRNESFLYTTPFALPKGSTIHVFCRGYLTNIAIISICNTDGSNIVPKVISTDSTFKHYQYTATENDNIILSCSVNYPLYVIIDNENCISENNNNINTLTNLLLYDEFIPGISVGTITTGKNAQNNGGKVYIVSGTDAYKVLKYELTNEKALRLYCSAGSSTSWALGFCYVDENNNIIEQYNAESSGIYTVDSIVPEGATAIYVNGINITPTCTICSIEKKVNRDYQNYISPELSLSLFENIGVIGDSYASGELYYNGDYHDKYNISWGQQIARKFGVQCINFSSGGLSTRTWLTATKGLPKLLNDPAQDLYMFVLGINDYYHYGIDYLGTIEDITSHESYVDYGDTFYGNYGRIIEQTAQHAPNAKLVMFGLAGTQELAITFDNAIREIAIHYNIPYINQKDDDFYLEPVYTNMSGGHPTAIGYARMAIAFERLLAKCILDNLQYFRNYKMYD